MDNNLHNKLKEVAEEYAKGRFDVPASKTGFIHGGEWMFKEAIAQAKEWLKNNAQPKYIYFEDGQPWIDNAKLLADFEADMNKLWEEQK